MDGGLFQGLCHWQRPGAPTRFNWRYRLERAAQGVSGRFSGASLSQRNRPIRPASIEDPGHRSVLGAFGRLSSFRAPSAPRDQPLSPRRFTGGNPLGIVATYDYAVVMTVVSIRFSDEPLHQRLKASAHQHEVGVSTMAQQLIDEGLRMQAHPMVVFRDGLSGRRPVLVGGPEVADAVGAIVGGDVPVAERRSRAADLLRIPVSLVDAAVAYYADHTDEIDELLAERARLADEAEASWRRQRELLER